jgi:hypothetical protein
MLVCTPIRRENQRARLFSRAAQMQRRGGFAEASDTHGQ